MTIQTVAWFENGDFGGVDTNLAAVADESVSTEDDFIRVPTGVSNLIGEMAILDADTINDARIEAPSLRQLANQDIAPVFLQQDIGAHPWYQFHPSVARALAVGESLEAIVNTDQAATPTESGDHWVIAWLADGPQAPATGNIFTVRTTASITQQNGAWVSGNLEFTQRLPIANYQVVGMRVESSDGIVGRLVFIGGAFRPGVPVVPANNESDAMEFRYGRAGVFGTFDLNQPPSLEILGGVATSQVVFLDLIRQG